MAGGTERKEGGYVVSTRRAFQLLFLLLAIWTGFSGFIIAVVGGSPAEVLSGGIEDQPAAARLLGAHLLLITPLYLLLMFNMDRFRWLLWFPVAAQAALFIPSVFDVIAGNRDFPDAAVPILVSGMFLVLMLAVLVLRERRGVPEAPPPGPEAAPGATESTDLSEGRFKRTVVGETRPEAGSGAEERQHRP